MRIPEETTPPSRLVNDDKADIIIPANATNMAMIESTITATYYNKRIKPSLWKSRIMQ